MTTSLVTYGTNVATSTLTSAGKLAIATGGTGGTVTMLIGTATGYGELMALGNAGAWASSLSMLAPSGSGWLRDTTMLAGQTIPPGLWTPEIKCKVSTGSIIADMYVRACAYDIVALTYTLIGIMKLAAQTITTTATFYTFAATQLPAYTFGTNQRLYLDYPLNITSNSMSAGATLILNEASTGASGIAGVAQMTTPGYGTQGYYNVVRPMHRATGRMM